MYLKDLNSFEDGMLLILNCIRNYDMISNVPFDGCVKMGVIYTIRRFALKYRQNLSLDEDITEDGGSLHDVLDSGMGIEGDEIERERLRSFIGALDKLTDSKRKLIEGFYFEGKTMMERSRGNIPGCSINV